MQVLIAIPIVAIISLVITTMLSNMSREIRVVQQKMEIMQFENYMIQIFADDNRCGQMIDGKAVSPAGSTTSTPSSNFISLPRLQQGTSGMTYVTKGEPLNSSSQVKVSDIQLGFLQKTGTTDEYQAMIKILWDTSNMPMSIKPITIQKNVLLDPSTNKILNCSGASGGGGGGGCKMLSMKSGCTVSASGGTCDSKPSNKKYQKPEQLITCNCPSGQHPTWCQGTVAGYTGPSVKSGIGYAASTICAYAGFGTMNATGCSLRGYGAYTMDMSCCD